MTRFFVRNFGCRATQADGAALEAQLTERGLDASTTADAADAATADATIARASAAT